MKSFAILSFISFLISFFLGAYVLLKAPEKKLNVIFFIFSFAVAALCFIEYEFRMAESLEWAIFWSKIQSIWPFALAISLHFVVEIKEIKKRKNLIYLLIYIPAIVIFLIDIQTNLITDNPVNVPWGWYIQRPNNIVSYLSASWAIIVLLLSVYLPFKYYLGFTGVKKNQVFLIFVAFAINLVFSLITDVIFPLFNLTIPELSNTLSVIPFAIIAFAIWKYQLFEINPNSLTGKLLLTINDGVFLTNSKLEIIEVNKAGLNMLNYQSNELIGKGIDFIVDKTSEQAFSEQTVLKIIEEKGKLVDVEVNFCDKNKKIIPVSISLSIIYLDNQNKFGNIVVARDISARKQADDDLKNAFNKLDDLVKERTTNLTEVNEQLIISKEKAEESERLKSAFLANMSHEIRTPMNGILGFASLLKEPELSIHQQKEYVRIIEKSGIRMLNIINDIIDISKIESGLTKLDIKESNINQQIEYIYTFFKPEIEGKGMTISFINALPENESIIKTDREKVFSILTNLVKNAIKYSKEGEIKMGYIVKGDYMEFYVRDAGIGIPKDRQKVIFERFIQADIEDKMARQGAGLGLSISKAYVEMLGGKIWVESEVGVGSIFYFTLPYQINSEEILTVKDIVSTEGEENNIRNLKILIAEDDETSEMLISIIVNEFCTEVLKAKTGKEAVEICHKNSDINLILMDIQMPDMNGYEATRQIRQFNKEVIIIAQTAFGLIGDRENTIEAGCNEYIAKPIIKDKLLALIQKHFKK